MTSAAAASVADSRFGQLWEVACAVVEQAAAKARVFRSEHEALGVETKSGRNDLVTAADKSIEDFVVQALAQRTGLPVMGEEGHSVDSFGGLVWVLDPIDGTMNFVQTQRDYAVSLALCEDGIPVLGVIADVVAHRVYSAIRGVGAWVNGEPMSPLQPGGGRRECVIITDLKEIQALPRLAQCLVESRGHRRYGSAALECVEVACGRAGAFVHMWVSPWDIAAAMVIVEQVGGRVTRLDGTPLDVRYKGSILAATPTAHQELLQRLFIDPS